eukprot:4267636-Amphidinium_carterae.1
MPGSYRLLRAVLQLTLPFVHMSEGTKTRQSLGISPPVKYEPPISAVHQNCLTSLFPNQMRVEYSISYLRNLCISICHQRKKPSDTIIVSQRGAPQTKRSKSVALG